MWLGITLGAVAAVSGALILGVVMPLSRSDHWEQYSRLGPFAAWPVKSVYLVQLVTALGYLPLASWRSLVCAAPLVGLNLSVAYSPQFSSQFQYDDLASVFLIVAAMHGAVVVLRAVGSTFKGRHAIATYIFMALVALLVTAPAASKITSLRRFLYENWPGAKERQLYRELATYRSLPFEIGIAAQQELGPYLSARPRYIAIESASSEAIATRRLKPGDRVLMTPIRDNDGLEQVLESDPKLTRVYVSPVLRVYEVNP
jgi:uncharacterized membrane protein